MGKFNVTRKSFYVPEITLIILLTALCPARSQAGFWDWFYPEKKEAPKEVPKEAPTPQVTKPHPVDLLQNPQPPKTFTIAGIEPAADSSGTVQITFTGKCYIDNLKDKLKLFPPVPIDWNNSKFVGNSVSLKGQFKYDQEYTVTIPEGTECSGNKYVKTITSFKVPDLTPDIQFIGTDTVIERDSRQMLHLKVTNVEELRFRGLAVPPLFAPQFAHALLEHAEEKPFEKAAAKRSRRFEGTDADSFPARKVISTTIPFETLRDDFRKKYEQLIAIPEAVQEFGDLLAAPYEDSQLFFPGKVKNKTQEFSVPLSFRKDKEKGVIEAVQLSGEKKPGETKSPIRLYRVTDLGITYKLSKNSLLLWVTSLNSGKPVAEVSLAAFLKNSEVIPLGKTDNKGMLFVKGPQRKPRFSFTQNKRLDPLPVPIREIEFIAAASPFDRTYIEIRESGDVRPDWVTQTNTVNTRTNLSKGQVFTERGIYRPGEKVFFKGVVREYRDGLIRPPSKTSPRVTIVNSKNEEIYSKELKVSPFGTINDSLDVKPFFPLGTYTVTMKYADEQPVSAQAGPGASEGDDEGDDSGLPPLKQKAGEGMAVTTFEVQEFVAPRHFVELAFKRETRTDESYVNLKKDIDLLVCTISGKYYAGGPVKHGKVRWKASYRGTDFKYKDFRNFIFGSTIEEPLDLIESGESILDEKGQVNVTFPVSREVAAGLYSVEVSATVVDFDGKASSDTASYQEDPAYKVGLSRHDPSVRSGDMLVLKAIVVDQSGKKLQSGDMKIDVLREDWMYVRKRNEQGGIYWEDRRVYRKDHSSTIRIKNSEAIFDFDFAGGGTYLIKATYKGSDGKEYSSSTIFNVEGYSFGYQDRQRNFERLSVSTERKEYAPGETIKVLIFPRKPLASVMMTIERKGLFEYRNLGPVSGKKYIDIPVENRHEPNIYISFLGTVSRKDFPLHSGQFDDKAPDFVYGVTNVEIKRERGDLQVKIEEETPELKFEPGSQVSLKVASRNKAGAGVETEMALCVVDESVLALTRFKTPVLDDLARFIAPLSVFTGELRTELLKQTPYGFIRNEPLTGGDGGGGREISLSKIRKDFRPVAFFTPDLRTDKEGHAEVTFTLPDTMTNYRVYAVACDKGSRFASSERGLLSVKDFYLEPGTPRFFTKGDTFRFYVSAFNKTKEDGTAKFSLAKDESIKLTAGAESYVVKARDRTLIPVKGEALQAGAAKLLFAGELGEKKDSVEIKVPVRSGHVLWNDVVFGTVKGVTDLTYRFPEYLPAMDWKGLHAEDVQALLTISGSPFIRMSKGLRYLLHYPYGCVEQTSSSVMPLAALRALIKEGMIPDITIQETDKFVKPGIDRLLSMQTGSGGFGYWPGNTHPDMWGTIYALTALTQAQLAGLEVPPGRIALGMDYLIATLKEQGNGDRAFRGYAVYLLAMNGRLDPALFRDTYRELHLMPRDAALMTLLAAKAANALPEIELREKAGEILLRHQDKQASYSFHAWYREPAVALLAAATILKDDAVSGRMSKELLAGITPEGIWTSTSDTGWSLVALGEYFRDSQFTGKAVQVTLRQAGMQPVTVLLNPKESYTYALDSGSFLKNPVITVSTEPGADLISMLSLTFPRTDLAKQGYSKGFTINKTIENTDGSKEIRVGDIVKVRIDLETTDYSDYNYLVLDDPLPAGLVAINSAIKTEETVQKNGPQNEYSLLGRVGPGNKLIQVRSEPFRDKRRQGPGLQGQGVEGEISIHLLRQGGLRGQLCYAADKGAAHVRT